MLFGHSKTFFFQLKNISFLPTTTTFCFCQMFLKEKEKQIYPFHFKKKNLSVWFFFLFKFTYALNSENFFFMKSKCKLIENKDIFFIFFQKVFFTWFHFFVWIFPIIAFVAQISSMQHLNEIWKHSLKMKTQL